jgi:hypothetical protein
MIAQGLLSLGGLWSDLNLWSNLMSVVQDGGTGCNSFLEHFPGSYGFGHRLYGGGRGPVVWKSVEELPRSLEYDFIIVGGEFVCL